MFGNINDYYGIFAVLDFHHVGILTDVVPVQVMVDCDKWVEEFQCHCYRAANIEYVVPKGGKLLESLQASGTRLHHLAYRTHSLEAFMKMATYSGFKMLHDEHVEGVGDTRVNFIMPEGRGVLIEIVERYVENDYGS